MAGSPKAKVENEFQNAFQEEKNCQEQTQRKNTQERVHQQANCRYYIEQTHEYLPEKALGAPRLDGKDQMRDSRN
jgi:hypothetical protein